MLFRNSIAFALFASLSLLQTSLVAQTVEPIRADPSLGTPVIADQEVTGIAGEPITITLKAETNSPASVVEFVLRDVPMNGDLGLIVSVPGNRSEATVTYQPGAGGEKTDSFTYTARYRGSSGRNGLYARSATVKINLSEAQPIIESPGVTTFGSIMLGEEVVRDIYLRNTGNAAYSAQLDFGGDDAQFHVVHPADGIIRVPVNGASVVKIAYRPTKIGKWNQDIVFHENKGGGTRFEAHSFAPFKLGSEESEVAKFVFQEDSRVRSVEIPLINSATNPVTLNIIKPPRVRVTVGETLTLLPGQPEASISLFLPEDDVRPFSGDLILSVGDYTQKVALSASATPAYLTVNTLSATRDAIDFGTVPRGLKAERNIILQNVGGGVAHVDYLLNKPFTMQSMETDGSAKFVVPAEGSHQLSVRFTAPAENGGQFREKLQLVTADGQKLVINLSAEVPSPEVIIPSAMQARLDASRVAPPETDEESKLPLGLREMTVEQAEARRTQAGHIAEEAFERTYSSFIPPITEASFTDISKNSISLRWKMAGPGQVDYDIEMLGFVTDPDTMMVSSVWFPYTDVEYRVEGEEIFATVGGLIPKKVYEIRVFTLGPRGRSSTPVQLLPILTRSPMDWTWIYVGFFLFVASAIWFFIYRLKRAREDD